MDRHFTGTPSRVGGVGLNVLAWECLDRHARAYPAASSELLPPGGIYAWRRDGEFHGWNPETIATLQQAARDEDGADAYERFATYVNEVAVPKTVAARAAQLQGGGRASAARRDRARGRDREALQVGRHVARRAVARGARDARHRHEPAGRKVEHRRGRRGPGPLRRRPPLGDQAGGLRPLRRDRQLPRERGRAADQGRPGRQARRGRPAAGAQGRPLHRAAAPFDPGRGPDLAAAAPRHLLDRGPEAADLRPPLREPARSGVREARVRGGRGHGRGRRGEGERRPRGDRGPRRRHGRLAAGVDPARRASRGRSASPRPSRRSSATTSARASSSRPTARCAPAATW